MKGEPPARSASAVLTVPNVLSFARIVAIPVFVWLIVQDGTRMAGLLVFAAVSATDWVDGYIARRTGAVTEIGKLLDPTADRLVIAAGLIAMVVAGAFPLWAALLILARDAAILAVGGVLLATRGRRIDVRVIGKVATFTLMVGVPLIAWGNLGLPQAGAATVGGWTLYALGVGEYYAATVLYAGDLRRAFAERRPATLDPDPPASGERSVKAGDA